MNPEPLGPEWIEAELAKRSPTITTRGFREAMAVREAVIAGRFTVVVFERGKENAEMIWHVSRRCDGAVAAFSTKRRLRKAEQGVLF